jgi:hypothetical protein
MRTVRRSSRVTRDLRTWGITAVLAAVSACSHVRPGAAGVPERAIIIFTNESLAQADVFAVAQGISARRIGTVMAGRTDSLVVPQEITSRGTVQLVARLLASSSVPSSGTVGIHPGDRLLVRLPLDERMLVVLPGGP